MTFSINAMGTRDDVLKQIAAAQVDVPLGEDLKALLPRYLAEAGGDNPGGPGYEIRYKVTASGHNSPGSPLSFTAACEAHYVQVPVLIPDGGQTQAP